MNNTFRQVAIASAWIVGLSLSYWVAAVTVQKQNTPEQVQRMQQQQAESDKSIQLSRYTQRYNKCTYERPGSEARLDCMWEAKRDYPNGYALHERNELLRLAAENGYNVKAN